MLRNLLIYDLDGTLVDTARTVCQILNEIRAEDGLDALDISSLTPWLSLGGEDLVRYALGIEAVAVPEKLSLFRNRYAIRPTDPCSVYPEVMETLHALRDLDIQLAICTNKPRHLAEKVLKETQLDAYFGFIHAGGDLPTRKPHPDNLRSCLDYFGATPDTALLIGDSRVDAMMAHDLGVSFILYRPSYNDGVESHMMLSSMDNHLEILPILNCEENALR